MLRLLTAGESHGKGLVAVLEGGSARETAARVAAGACCKAFLAALGMDVLSHVVRIGKVRARDRPPPEPGDRRSIDASPVRSADPETARAMVAEIDRLRKD